MSMPKESILPSCSDFCRGWTTRKGKNHKLCCMIDWKRELLWRLTVEEERERMSFRGQNNGKS